MSDMATLQLLAYATLTFTGICIAAAALMFSYRQNYGWDPLVLVTSHGLGSTGPDEEYIAQLSFEFWNRRRYPVVIRIVEVDFGALRLHEKASSTGEMLTWGVFNGKPIFRDELRIDPATHHRFECKGAFPKRTIDDLDVLATVRIVYFDPLSDATREKRVLYRYSFINKFD